MNQICLVCGTFVLMIPYIVIVAVRPGPIGTRTLITISKLISSYKSAANMLLKKYKYFAYN